MFKFDSLLLLLRAEDTRMDLLRSAGVTIWQTRRLCIFRVYDSVEYSSCILYSRLFSLIYSLTADVFQFLIKSIQSLGQSGCTTTLALLCRVQQLYFVFALVLFNLFRPLGQTSHLSSRSYIGPSAAQHRELKFSILAADKWFRGTEARPCRLTVGNARGRPSWQQAGLGVEDGFTAYGLVTG